MRKVSLRERLRYRFDNTISRGSASVIAYLAVITLALIVVAGVVLAVTRINTGDENQSVVEGTWKSLMRTLDAGTMGGDAGWGFRIVGLLVTLGGIFIVSALIGLITTGIEGKIDQVRKGRTAVLEEGHTLILGWSPKLFTIISELVVANKSESRSSIVVLAQQDKVEMEEQIRERVKTGKTRIVCRTGDPSDPNDLLIANVMGSKSVIVLAPEDQADALVIKTALALMKHDPTFAKLRVVAELHEARNAAALKGATQGRVTVIVSSDVIARITAQVCRQSGLSFVYQDLLDFDGDEIYFTSEPKLFGSTFGDALLAYADSTVIGVRKADGRIKLAPPGAESIEQGDRIVAIASDDSTLSYSPVSTNGGAGRPSLARAKRKPEHLFVVGWNALAPAVLRQLDKYVAPRSRVTVLYDPQCVGGDPVAPSLKNLRVDLHQGDTTSMDALQAIMSRSRFDHIMIMCYRQGLPLQEAEARVLLTLVQVRQIISTAGWEHVRVVTELLDVRDVDLARIADPDDYLVSESLTSLMLAQLAENPELSGVFDDLFDAEGAEITLELASNYCEIGKAMTFADIVVAVRAHDHVVIGYRQVARANGSKVQMVLNPAKARPVSFGANDQLIILS